MRYTSNVVFKTSETTADRKEDSEWWNIYTIMLSLLAGGSAGRGSYRSGESKEEHKWGGDSSLEFRELDITNYFNIADAAAIDAISESWHTTHHYTWADLCALATEQTNKYFAANSEYGILGMHDYASADGAGGGYGSSADHRGNRVVINDGWFFFDWEKAMHTQSALAQFVSPSALNRFLGYRVPYRAFPVISVVLERRGAIYPFEVPTARCQMMLECRMHTPYNDYNPSTDSMVGSPRSAYSVHEVRGTLTPHSALQDFAFAEIDFHRPGGDISSPPTTKSYSYLKFVNFDTVNGDIYTGLKTLRNFAPWTPEFPYVPVALGSRPCGDYRLMAYNFRDIMDDDIAYYNATVGNKDPSSRSSLETRAADWLDGYNTTGEPFGEYIVKVACEDKSLEEIKKIERELVRPAIERFEEYAARANELCSYNNIENKFNTFFATGMESVYNVGTMPAFTTFAGAPDNQPPWFEIPYLIAAFYYTFGRQYKSPDIKNYDLEQQILDNAVIIAKMCNPRTGSLNGIISVRAMLQKLQDILLLQDSRSRDRIRQIVGDETITHIDDIFDMAYTGMSADSTTSTDDIDFSTFGGTVPSPCAVFFGSMNQDQPIFGDVMIDNADMFLDIEGLEEPPDVDAPFDPEDHEEHDTTCFVAGTMVKMADGTDKRIEDVEIGETLLGHNGVLNTVLEFDHPMLGNRQLYAINDGKPFITGDHPMRSTDGWKAIYPEGTENNARHTVELHRDHGVETTQLLPGDKLILIDGNLIQVHSITAHDAQPQRLYNFMLDGNHTYYADGYLVHNACAGDDGPEGEAGVPMKQCKDEDGSIIAEVAITAPCPPGTSSDTDMFEVAADTEADTEALEG